MEYKQWFEMLSEINAYDNLNGDNVIEKVKESLKQKDRDAYDNWCDNQFNINFLFKNQFTLLHVAANYNLTKVVKLLLEKEAEVNKKNNEGWTPLHLAADNGHIETVNTLIDKKADVNVVNTLGDDPLRLAVSRGSTKTLEALIAKGANVKKKYDDESTPLHYAKDIETIKILLDKGADVKGKDKEGSTPLHCVCNIETLDPEIINILIDKGSDVNAKSNNGKTPLHVAAKFNNTGVVINLLKKGANCNEKCNDGLTPLHYAAPFMNTQKIKALIENKADVRAEDKNKRTPLHLAAGNIAKILIEKEANVNATDKDGKTPLHLAVERGDEPALEVLVKNKADINKKDNHGQTPLHYAIDNQDRADYLIENGADINVVDEEGKTPLYLAYLKYKQDSRLKQDLEYKKEIVTFLMNKGADPLLGNRDAKFLGYVDRLIKNNGVEHSEKGEQQKETEINNEYELLLLGNNTSLAHIVKREALYDLISEWFSDVHNLATDNQKKLNTELLSVLRDIPTSCNIEGLKNFLENNKGNGDLKFILDLQRGKSKLTVLHAIPSIRDMIVKKDIDWVIAKFMGLLVEAGADPNISDNEGQTPLHYAAHFNCFEAMRSLLNHRARNKPDKQGKTPLDVVMTNSKEPALSLEQICLTGEQIKVKDGLYSIIYPPADSLFIDGGIAKYHCLDLLKNFLGKHEKTESFQEVLNLRDCQGRSRVFQQIRKVYAKDSKNLKEAEKLLTKAGAIDYKGWENKEYLPKSHTIWENFIVQQQEKLERALGHVSKAKNMNELAQVVKEAIADGVRLSFTKQGSLYNKKYENQYGFVDYVIRQIGELKKNSPNREKDIEIASHIVRYLVSKGAVLHNIYSKFVIDELEEFAGHKDNMKQAFIDYQNHTQKFMEVAKSATSGKVKDAKMDNSTLYLEYSEDSSVQVAKIADGARKLGITQGKAGYGRNVIKIGTSEVEVITENGKRNYTNLGSGNGVSVVFFTSLGELKVNLYPQDENKIRVEVTDKKKWEDLKNKKEVIGKDCFFVGRSVYEAIEQGYFERHGKIPQPSEKIILPNEQKVSSWSGKEEQRRSKQGQGLGIS